MTGPLPYARMYAARIVLAVALIALFAEALFPGGEPSRLGLLVGRFHPLVVHLPIGILVVAVALFAWTRLGFGRAAASALPTLTHLGAWAAVAAAWAGLKLEAGGGYGGTGVLYHKIGGLAVATIAVVLVFMDYGRLRQGVEAVFEAPVRGLHRATAAVLFAALVVTGHLGGTLTHGEGYLTEYMPGFIRSVVGAGAASPFEGVEDPGALTVYEALVRPALGERCVSCHKGEKARGKLRLDSPEGILEGGTDGEVLAPGRPDASEMMRRIRLPASHEDRMPPRGRPGPTVAEAVLLEWWIREGASFELTLADAEQTPAVRTVLEGMGLGDIPTGIFALRVEPPDTAAVRALGEAGMAVVRLGENAPFLSIRCVRADACLTDEQVLAMEPLSDQIAWVDLSAADVDDERLAAVARLPHLARLHLQRTRVTDAGVALIAGREFLEYLNLYGTAVTDSSLDVLAGLPSLGAVYLWQSGVTAEGAARLREMRPDLVVDTGITDAPADAADGTGGGEEPAGAGRP